MSRPPLPTCDSSSTPSNPSSPLLSSPPSLADPITSISSNHSTRRPALPPIRPSASPSSSPTRPSNLRSRSVVMATISPRSEEYTNPLNTATTGHPGSLGADGQHTSAGTTSPELPLSDGNLPAPAIAGGSMSAVSPRSGFYFTHPPGRSRAHTVSVSLRSSKQQQQQQQLHHPPPPPLSGSAFRRASGPASAGVNEESPKVSFDIGARAGSHGREHGQGNNLNEQATGTTWNGAAPTTGTGTGTGTGSGTWTWTGLITGSKPSSGAVGEAETKSRRRSRSSVSSRRRSVMGRSSSLDDPPMGREGDDIVNEDGELNDDVVGLLDCVDPTVGTVNHLQNMTNSIIFPNIPQLWTRRPNLTLPDTPTDEDGQSVTDETFENGLPMPATSTSQHTSRSRASTFSHFLSPNSGRGRSQTISVMPSGFIETANGQSVALNTLTREEFAREMEDDIAELEKEHELDRHVKHVLSKKQSRIDTIKGVLRGIWAFIKTPMGAFTAIYGFLVAFWGAAIVLFLLGWIHTSSKYRQDVWVEISSQVENGLFTLTGVGLIPWRIIDTYRMSVIHTLKMKTIRLRKQRGLPPIDDPDDLPDPLLLKDYVSVLTEKEQERLRYHQEKFSKSQTWYRAHATATHRAFPIKWALWNTILMDGNSFFQCLLCGCMWGMNWHVRPPWTTGCLIPLSFLCGIGAAVLIWQGSVRTKKTVKVEDKLREALGVPLVIAQPLSVTARSEKTLFPDPSRLPRRRTIAAGEAPEVITGDIAGKYGVMGNGGEALRDEEIDGLKNHSSHEGKRRTTISAPQREPGIRSLDRKAGLKVLEEGKPTVVEEEGEEVEEEEMKMEGKTRVDGVTTLGA